MNVSGNHSVSSFSRSLVLVLGLFVAVSVDFIFYVRAEKALDQAHHSRHQSLLLADELRQSSDDLTNMVRLYVSTGNPVYKQYYLEILDIRDGKQPRPYRYEAIYWDTVLAHGKPQVVGNPASVPLLEMMRQAGFTQHEFNQLAEAKHNSDALTKLEFEAMAIIDAGGQSSEAERSHARLMLYGEKYLQAKAGIMRPIDEFFERMNRRTAKAVQDAKDSAIQLRILFVLFALAFVMSLLRNFHTLRSKLGGNPDVVHSTIERIGSGDFSVAIPLGRGDANSILGWLEKTRDELYHLDIARKAAEAQSQRMTKLYAALSQCNQAIVRCNNEAELFPLICRDAVNFGGLKMAWIGLYDPHSSRILPVSSYGEGVEYLDGIQISIDANLASGSGPTGISFREDRAVWCQDFQHDESTAPWHERSARYGWGSSASLPLHRKHAVIGTFTLYSGEINAFDEAAKNLLVEMAMDISYALDRFTDKAEQLRMQSALVESGEAFRSTFNQAAVGIARVGLDGSWLQVNQKICDIVGYSKEELLKLTFQDITHPEDLNIDFGRIKQMLDGSIASYSLEKRYFNKSGAIVWIYLTVGLARNPDGSPKYFISVVEDISKRKETESALDQKRLELVESESRLRKVLQNLNSAIVVHSADTRITFSNPRASEILGLTQEQMNVRVAVDPEWHFINGLGETLRLEDYPVNAVISSGKPIENQILGINIPGRPEPTWVLVGAFPEFDADGNLSSVVVNFHDITELKKTQDALLKLSLAVEQSPNTIVITDLDANIEYANSTFTKVTGYSLEEAKGQNPRILQSGRTPKATYTEMWKKLVQGEEWRGELVNRRKDGSEYIEWALISPVRQANGKITHYLAVKENITDKKFAEERIKQLAYFDQLTGLPNRSLLIDRFNYALSLAQRSGEQLAVMFLDLDRFKDINDTLGHSIGDQVLIEISRRLKSAVRDEDTVSRQGGDEFILVLPGTDEKGAARVASKLLEVVSKPCLLGEHELVTTPSIGIAVYPNDGRDLETLLKNADAAMYRVKSDSHNDFRFFTFEMQTHSARTLMLSNALRHALENNEFLLHYQPQFTLKDGNIIGAEALLRWQHPELGLVSPVEFIPIAEDTGQIIQIGEWVLRTAIRQLREWIAAGLPPMVIAVNVSAAQFRQANLPELVTQLLDESEVPHEFLELELTEAVAMDAPLAAIEMMDKLHAGGIRMSIDDFGTGYSSLSYLKRFKVYKLKIDQSFVRDISVDQDDKAIVTAIINMASSLGMQTIAEGVETAGQLAFLRLQGCDEVQGYYFSRPLAAKQFEAFIRSKISFQ